MSSEIIQKDKIIVVGVGASAGGLEALQALVKNINNELNMAFVVAQHLSPTYKSLMVSLLSKDSNIEILEAHNLQVIEKNKMYICPPNKNITVQNGNLVLTEPKLPSYGPKPSIDLLFESLADCYENNSVGIILSGTGSDGSRGVRAIKAEGGFTISQQPNSAKYDGMPNSAINTGHIDLILDVEVMIEELEEILKYPTKAMLNSSMGDITNIYKNILEKLKKSKNIDFSLYKSSTIQRRIERRLVALKMSNIADYNNYLMKNEKEMDNLFNDILIGVTAFFRDIDPFVLLKEELTNVIRNKKDNNIRIWIPGCSTGEEVYTIAIILSEILKEKAANYKIQIFATDVDVEATNIARKGLYPESAVFNIDKNLVKKYFLVKNDLYEVIKPIREMCIFSKHDITSDPAFMRLDLISCRNLLIYFTSELQKKIFPMFHYSLNEGAILLLGKSESIGVYTNYFKAKSTKWKLYEALYIRDRQAPQPVKNFEIRNYKEALSPTIDSFKQPTINDLIVEHIERNIIPMCVVLNESFNMIYIKGKNPYLIQPEGEITQNIFKYLDSEISLELRSALHLAQKESRVAKTGFIQLNPLDTSLHVRIVVSPLDSSMMGDMFLICFQEEESSALSSYSLSESNENDELDKLTLELERTREHLQTVIEELETSNEEMQSLNEELQSSNEELQSSNEELETTNEELQSTNEELQTAYTELQTVYEDRDKNNKNLLNLKSEYELMLYRYDVVLESSNIGIYDFNILNHYEIFIDDRFANILGYTKDEIISLANDDFMDWYQKQIRKADREKRVEAFEQLLLGKIDNFRLTYEIQTKNSKYIKIESFSTALRHLHKAKVDRIIGTIKEVK